jgi:hypothetical protein
VVDASAGACVVKYVRCCVAAVPQVTSTPYRVSGARSEKVTDRRLNPLVDVALVIVASPFFRATTQESPKGKPAIPNVNMADLLPAWAVTVRLGRADAIVMLKG